jgi:Lon protease-like protein
MISENHDKASDMRTATLDEASDLLRKIAGNREADESKKAVFRRLGRKLSDWSHSRIRGVWYRDSRVRLRAEEVDQLRSIVGQQEGKKAEINELATLRDRIARIERLLEATDPAFHSPAIAAARQQLGEVGGKPRAVD